MSIDGHWIVRFASVAGDKVQNESGGVATLGGGRIFGGDTWSYYSGSYQLTEHQLSLTINVSIHFTVGGQSILGGPLVPHTLAGRGHVKEDGRRIDALVHVAGDDTQAIAAILTKVVDLL